jgi:endonuclease/exonuclease/phosphatase family metal-dependent hydrolase
LLGAIDQLFLATMDLKMNAKVSHQKTVDPGAIRILSYNIHKGFSLDRRFVLAAIKSAIEATDADLIFLQEVIGENKKHSEKVHSWPVTTQLEFLADTLWPHFAYGKNAVYTEGHHGNAVLSRHPVIRYENIDISNNRFERRGLLHATIEPMRPGLPELHAICVHLDLFESGRNLQIDRIVQRIRDHVPDECPLIIAGDFNDWREKASPMLESELGVHEVFQKLHGCHAKSFPAWFPFLRLDRIYVRGFVASEAVCFTESPWDKLSDHGAVMAHLAIADFTKGGT